MTTETPSISVVLCAMDSFQTLEQTLSRLVDQSIRKDMELVLVGPPQEDPWWTRDLRDVFHSVSFVETDPFVSIGESNAAGARRASADIVAFGEDHCFPEPEWAEALVRSHREGWTVVGPEVRNANPDSAVSRADFLIGYSPWAAPCESGERGLLPGHNSSYKKRVLLDCGDLLAERLQAETVLHYDLVKGGEKLFATAAAKTAHVNFSRASTWFRVQTMQGRVFAAERRRDWSLVRRLLFAAASPLIPAVRLARITGQYFATPRPLGEYLGALPCLALGLTLDGAGQFVGYAFGAGRTVDSIAALELRRVDHVTDRDRQTLFAPDALRVKLAGRAS